jgi:hypothetical protein
VLFALALFGLLLLADWSFDAHGISLLAQYSPRLATTVLHWKEVASVNYGSIQSFIGTIVQLSGLFLTLYFTAVSVIASAVYARVPGDVRTLVVEEKVGNIYVRIVAILGAITILYLLTGVIGVRIGIVGLGVIGALSVVSLFSFLVLGKRAFNFFQPTALVQYVVNDVANWMTLAARRKRSLQTRSLQDYFRRRAEARLGTYRNIVSLVTKEEFHRIESDALITLLQGTIELVTFYANRKSAISSESLWFEKISKHANWLTVGHTQLDMALRTGRPVDPELVPNFLWVEERAGTILHTASSSLTAREDPRPWFDFANRLYYRLEKLAHVFAVEEALLFFRSQRKEIGSLVDGCKLQPTSGSDESNQQLSFYLGALSFVSSDLMAISIGFARRAQEVTEDSIRALADDLLSDNPTQLYSSHLPRAVLTKSESLLNNLRAEKFVENQIFTPSWYVRQLLARSFIEYFRDTCSLLISEAEQTLQPKLDTYKPDEQYLLLAEVISSGIEVCDKLHAHFGWIEKCVDLLNRFRQVKDVPWSDVDFRAHHDRISGLHAKLMLAAANILFPLDSLPRSRYWPDYFGQMYTFVAREAYLAMERGDESSFAKLFTPLFAASISANQRLRDELKDREPQVMLAWSTSPLQDIVEVSGYAKLFSELDGKSFYNLVVKIWNKYLDTFDDPTIPLRSVTALLTYRRGNFFSAARDFERGAWKQSFERLLRERRLLGDPFDYDMRPQVTHASKLIREFTRSGIGLEDASDVFVVDFIMPRLKGLEVDSSALGRGNGAQR